MNASFVENKCNFLTFLLQQKLALLITLLRRLRSKPLSGSCGDSFFV